MEYKEMFALLGRYIFLVLLALFGFFLIYYLLTPLTIYPVYLLLKIVYSSIILLPGTNTLFIEGNYISLVSACIAGSAYYLLLLLNFTTPMNIKTRVKSISFLIISFLFLNIIRIFIFSILYLSGYSFFDLTHKVVWYIGSTFLVVGLWFLNVWVFKINAIPFYSDVKNIFHDVINKDKQ